jgi:hypothetical protein
MASADVCDTCLEDSKTVQAEKYCSECEENYVENALNGICGARHLNLTM